MSEAETKSIITILEGNQTLTMFPAPADSYVARSLWVFLVENLRPDLEVTLVHDKIRLRHATGQKIPIELYERIMDGR